MPSASNKLEKQASLEVPEPFKSALSVVEKRMRNLEKRKARLDTYKTQAEQLQEQQKEALSKYEEVVSMLDFSRDLVKQLTQSSLDAIKMQKKQAKRDQMEHQAKEIQRIKEVLMINNVLGAMGDDKTREDFLGGKNGALTITEEDLQRLDSLFKLVTPTRTPEEDEPTPYEQQLTSASEHLCGLLDGKKKEVLGVTYTTLKDLIFGIHNCGYFKPETEKETQENSEVSIEDEAEKTSEETPVEAPASVDEAEVLPDPVSQSSFPVADTETVVLETDTYQMADNSVFSTFSHTKPYSELQGSFNFLQESQIDPDSPHMDPAVVAAHPMIPSSNRSNYPTTNQSPAELLPSQYSSQGVGDTQQLVLNANSSTVVPQSHFIQPVSAISATHLPDFSQIPTQTFTNQHYVAVQTFTAPIYNQVPSQQVAANDEGNWISDNNKHLMNVNATAFESINFKEEQEPRRDEPPTIEETSEPQKFASNNDNQGYQSVGQGNFQSRSGYNYRSSGNGGRGSSNGGGGRGGPRGGSLGMNNGYGGGGGSGRGNRQNTSNNYSSNGNSVRSGSGGNYQGYRGNDGYNNYQRDNFNGSGTSGSGYGNSNGVRRAGAGGNNVPRGNKMGLSGNSSRGGSRGGGNFAKASA